MFAIDCSNKKTHSWAGGTCYVYKQSSVFIKNTMGRFSKFWSIIINSHEGRLPRRGGWGFCVRGDSIYVERPLTDFSWILLPQVAQELPVANSTGIIPIKPLCPAHWPQNKKTETRWLFESSDFLHGGCQAAKQLTLVWLLAIVVIDPYLSDCRSQWDTCNEHGNHGTFVVSGQSFYRWILWLCRLCRRTQGKFSLAYTPM